MSRRAEESGCTAELTGDLEVAYRDPRERKLRSGAAVGHRPRRGPRRRVVAARAGRPPFPYLFAFSRSPWRRCCRPVERRPAPRSRTETKTGAGGRSCGCPPSSAASPPGRTAWTPAPRPWRVSRGCRPCRGSSPGSPTAPRRAIRFRCAPRSARRHPGCVRSRPRGPARSHSSRCRATTRGETPLPPGCSPPTRRSQRWATRRTPYAICVWIPSRSRGLTFRCWSSWTPASTPCSPPRGCPALPGCPAVADLRLLLSDGFAALGEPLAADGDRVPGWVRHPARPVPHLAEECAQVCGLDEDAAVLSLMLLALPDPSDRNVKGWTGRKPVHFKTAVAERGGSEVVLRADRARAGRSLFPSGAWQERKPPRLPLEASKLGLLSLARERRPTSHLAAVPSGPPPCFSRMRRRSVTAGAGRREPRTLAMQYRAKCLYRMPYSMPVGAVGRPPLTGGAPQVI